MKLTAGTVKLVLVVATLGLALLRTGAMPINHGYGLPRAGDDLGDECPADSCCGSASSSGGGGAMTANTTYRKPMPGESQSSHNGPLNLLNPISSPTPYHPGMAVWSVSEPYINLWLKDQPLGYQPAKGPAVRWQLGYKLREDSAGLLPDEFSVGRRWNCSWLSFLYATNSSYAVHLPNGGLLTLDLNAAPEFYSYARLEEMSGGYRLVMRGGQTNEYKMVANVNGQTRYYLTAQSDPVGQRLTFEYLGQGGMPSVAKLLRVIDADGRTNRLYYANTGNTNLITAVVDAFDRTNRLEYDSSSRLTNSVDPQGISSKFTYDQHDWVTNLITPYGTNSFVVTDDTNNAVYGVKITDAAGANQLWVYRGADGCSYHWGPRQFAYLSHADDLSNLTSDELVRARKKAWAGITGNTTLTSLRDYSPDGVNGGQVTGLYYSQMQRLPSTVVRQLPDGNWWSVDLDRNDWGEVVEETETYSLPDSSVSTRTRTFNYSEDGIDLLTTLDVENHIDTGIAYEHHLPVAITNVLQEVTYYTYNAAGQVTSVKTPYGLLTTNYYFSGGDYPGWLDRTVDLINNVPQRTNSYTYTNGLVWTHTDERGSITTNYWDPLSRRIGTGDGLGSTTNIFDKLDLVRTVDRMGFTNGFVFDRMRRLTDQYDALGRHTHYERCNCGLLEAVTDADSKTTAFEYDAAGRLVVTTGPDNYGVTNLLNLLGQIESFADTAGMGVTNFYNNQGLVYSVSNAVGRVSYREFDIHDRVVLSIDANGVTVTNLYDVAGRVIASGTPANGAVTAYAYVQNVPGVTSITNALTNVTWYAYDAYGRTTNEISGSSTVTLTTNQFAYDMAGALRTLTDGNAHTTTWNYDRFGRVTNKVDALSQPMFVYGYDADSRLTNRWTPARTNTAYRYDPVGNLTNVIYPTNPAIRLAYDALNRLTNLATLGVFTNSYTYNSVGQLLSEDGPWADDTVNYTYENRLRSQMSLGSWTQSYGYDAIKRLQTITSPAGEFAYLYADTQPSRRVLRLLMPGGGYVTNEFDALARLTDTRYMTPDGASILNGHRYAVDVGNQRTQQLRRGLGFTNTVDYAYDPLGQLTKATGKEADGSTARLQEQMGYAYDPAGNLKYRTNNALIQTFGVNSLNELTTLTRTGTVTVAGNTSARATSVTVNSQSANLYGDFSFAQAGFALVNGPTNYTAVANDGLGHSDTSAVSVNLAATNSFVYDLNGNLTFDGTNGYAYDDENQLIAVVQTNHWKTEFVYDGLLRCRIVRDYDWSGSWVLAMETRMIYDGMLVVQERNAANQVQVTYTRGNDLSGTLQDAGGIGGMLARTDATQTNALFQTAFYHSDGNGNITALVSQNGLILASYVYDPYGRTLAQSGPLATANTYRFSSKQYQANAALYYYGYRFYSPNLQRWVNRDPIEEDGGTNLYVLGRNDLANYVDPLGLDPGYGNPISGPNGPIGPSRPTGGQINFPEPTGPPPIALPPGKNGNPNEWENKPGSGPRGGRWGPKYPINSPKGGQPSASWDGINGHYDHDDGNGNRTRVLPDGTPVDHDNNPLPKPSTPPKNVPTPKPALPPSWNNFPIPVPIFMFPWQDPDYCKKNMA